MKEVVAIEVGPIRSTFTGPFPKDIVDEVTSVYKKGYQYSPAFRRRGRDGKRIWGGKVHFLNFIRGAFPTGLLPTVVRALKGNGHKVSINFRPDAAPLPVVNKDWMDLEDGVKAWDHQLEAVNAFLNGGKRG